MPAPGSPGPASARAMDDCLRTDARRALSEAGARWTSADGLRKEARPDPGPIAQLAAAQSTLAARLMVAASQPAPRQDEETNGLSVREAAAKVGRSPRWFDRNAKRAVPQAPIAQGAPRLGSRNDALGSQPEGLTASRLGGENGRYEKDSRKSGRAKPENDGSRT